MALQKDICWYKCRLFMRSSNPLWHFYQDTEIEKSIVPQLLFAYAASRILCFTTLDILAINSPWVGLPRSGLTVLPK